MHGLSSRVPNPRLAQEPLMVVQQYFREHVFPVAIYTSPLWR